MMCHSKFRPTKTGKENVAHCSTLFKRELEEIGQLHHLHICLHNSSDWGASRCRGHLVSPLQTQGLMSNVEQTKKGWIKDQKYF